ncbi:MULTISPECIES: hypothetical protein [Sphingomonadales]|jgi:hypothetical protein|uniref:PRTRC system protein F n=2 Tax=Sphingobium TaxID=165695 RepID=A0A0S3F1A3_9SPHN|nr:hypothetical protein [Sphingopyxis granuli]ALR21473.1 hypothetical protein ATN00_15420 [Sphingobium baderi]QUT08131.1 hypothetical protein KFK14_05750 [Sphingobium phenoxybenzoativorans]
MASHPTSPNQSAASRLRRSTRASSSPPGTAGATLPGRSRRRRACAFHPSADLAGRVVALSGDIPAHFDAPLAPHHKLIGRWAASRETTAKRYTRAEARQRIERVFDKAVLDILGSVEFADFRVVVLHGEEDYPPAIAVICDSMGQLELGWIEDSDAPIPWRAAAYKALDDMLARALPIFGYDDLFDEISMYYWDGATDDETARQWITEYQGVDPEYLDELTLPSNMESRRPEWMIAKNAGASAELPNGLRRKLEELRKAHAALGKLRPERNAWRFDLQIAYEYLPGIEECSTLPPLTLVPVEQFAREVDDVGRHGMEYGFMDIAGFCPLPDSVPVDDWLASLRVGARFLLAAQDLIQLDPANL